MHESLLSCPGTRVPSVSPAAEQRLVIESILDGQDVFVSLPPGTGKSLCYWILPSIFNQ